MTNPDGGAAFPQEVMRSIEIAAKHMGARLPLVYDKREIWSAEMECYVGTGPDCKDVYRSHQATCHSDVFAEFAILACNNAQAMVSEIRRLRELLSARGEPK